MIDDHCIERVAILMCEEMGLSPYDYVTVKRSASLTPLERRDEVFYPEPTRPIHFPNSGEPPYEVLGAPRIPEDHSFEPRWRTFRPDAAKAIAGWRAVHKYALIEG